jgi:predicted nucleotidyltransferase
MEFFLAPTQLQRLKKLGVGVVYLFGSYAEDKHHPLSDVDIGIAFLGAGIPRRSSGEVYNELYDIFTDLFPGKSVDIIFLENAGLELRFDAITHGRFIYEHSREGRLQFEEKTTLLYADFKPLLDEFDDAVLGRISA